MTRAALIATTALLGTVAVASGASATGLAPVGHGFTGALYVTQAPGEGRLMVVEQRGTVRPITKAGTPGPVWLDLRGQVSTGIEQGLLGLAFAPDFATSGRFYVDYTDRNGDTRVVAYRTTPGARRVRTGTARQVLFQHQPYANHNGGNLQFGPDGMLYIGFGDGGGQKDPDNNAANPSTWLGKILRIDVSGAGADTPYAIPAGNPFANAAEGRREIWALGLRNPWRFSFDTATGDLWIGDVGQNALEEVDRNPAGVGGLDFGWSRREGTDDLKGGPRTPTETAPVAQYPHGDDGCSITGGYVLRNGKVPELQGQYVYGDWCSGRTWAMPADRSSGPRQITSRLGRLQGLTSFGRDQAGNVYVVTGTAVKRIRA